MQVSTHISFGTVSFRWVGKTVHLMWCRLIDSRMTVVYIMQTSVLEIIIVDFDGTNQLQFLYSALFKCLRKTIIKWSSTSFVSYLQTSRKPKIQLKGGGILQHDH